MENLLSVIGLQIGQFPDLVSGDEDYPEGITVRDVLPSPDDRYDALSGTARLRALETALGSSRTGWSDDPAGRADDWLRQPDRAALVLNDLSAAEHGGDEFPRVWDRFGWAHVPAQLETADGPQRDLQNEADRVLA